MAEINSVYTKSSDFSHIGSILFAHDLENFNDCLIYIGIEISKQAENVDGQLCALR